MIDLDAIKGRANSAYLLDRDDGDALERAMGDVKTLLAEVERLRHDVADLQLQREQNIIDNMHAFQEGGHKERAAVVAWLLKRAENSYAAGTVPGTNGYEARMILEAIERGEHRREEER